MWVDAEFVLKNLVLGEDFEVVGEFDAGGVFEDDGLFVLEVVGDFAEVDLGFHFEGVVGVDELKCRGDDVA